jgi:MFS family permease
MIGSTYFAGYSIACFIIPRISDIYGRKLVVLISLWVQLIIVIGLTFSKNFFLTLGFMVVLGICGAGRGTVNYLYLLELMPKEKKVAVGTSANAINEFTYVWSSLLFRYIS